MMSHLIWIYIACKFANLYSSLALKELNVKVTIQSSIKLQIVKSEICVKNDHMN